MSDNDLVKLGDAEEARDELVRVLNYINTSGTLDYADYCELFDTIERVFDALKAAPREMTAREFLVAYKRMCASFPETDCSKCPIYTLYKDCTDNPCDWDIDKILPAVEKWAREHPEERGEDSNVN